MNILVLPDLHCPYHDEAAIDTVLSWASKRRIDALIQIGDAFDFFPLSFHDKDPSRRLTLEDELKVGGKVLSTARRATKAKKCYFFKGNHEHRLHRYLMRNAQQLLPFVQLEKLVDLSDWSVIPYMDVRKIGRLHFAHDVGFSGVTAARRAAVAVGHSIVTGHTHRLTLEYFGNMLGDRYVSATLGWLGDLQHIDYRHKSIAQREWTTGFGFVRHDDKRDVSYLQLHPIIKNRVEEMDRVRV